MGGGGSEGIPTVDLGWAHPPGGIAALAGPSPLPPPPKGILGLGAHPPERLAAPERGETPLDSPPVRGTRRRQSRFCLSSLGLGEVRSVAGAMGASAGVGKREVEGPLVGGVPSRRRHTRHGSVTRLAPRVLAPAWCGPSKSWSLRWSDSASPSTCVTRSCTIPFVVEDLRQKGGHLRRRDRGGARRPAGHLQRPRGLAHGASAGGKPGDCRSSTPHARW